MTNTLNYLGAIHDQLQKQWPDNKTVNIVCHGHSVPAGYFATPYVNSLEAYPQLLLKIIKQRFPFAVANVIVSAIGGENSESGMKRFSSDVLNHNPAVVTIDYGLNDRGIGLPKAMEFWENMIEKAAESDVKIILLTPSWDKSYFQKDENWKNLEAHAGQIRKLAEKHATGLADVFLKFGEYVKKEEDLVALLSHVNHPSEIGHRIIAEEIAKYFIAR
ncbi:MAG: GDSL-type esterase/lipase family protein [Oscillospiraceae bacterium]|nr:GDSL-type esterase/lipase family protein [Oscillospiraceae bacterium]